MSSQCACAVPPGKNTLQLHPWLGLSPTAHQDYSFTELDACTSATLAGAWWAPHTWLSCASACTPPACCKLGCLLNHFHSNVCPCALVCRVASFYKHCQPCASKRMMKGAGTLDSHFNTRKRTSQPAAPAKATRSASAVAKREQTTSAAATGPHTDGEPTSELSRSSAGGSQHAQHAQFSLCCVCMPCSQGPLHAHRSPPAFPIVASLERQHATVHASGRCS